MANLFDVNFNSNPGTPFGFSALGDSTSGLSVAAGAALAGTAYGLNCNINDTTSFYGICLLGTANTSGMLEVRFYFDPNSLTMADGNEFYLFRAQNNSYAAIANVRLRYTTAAGYQIRASAVNDAGSETPTTSLYVITDAPHCIEIKLTRASTADANDGILQLWIDDVSKETVTTVDNNGKFVNFWTSRFGATTTLNAGTSGDFFLDELIINDDNTYIGPLASGDPEGSLIGGKLIRGGLLTHGVLVRG